MSRQGIGMSQNNSLIAFLFLASPIWSQQQLQANRLQTGPEVLVTPTAAAGNEVPFKGRLEGIDFITPIDAQFFSSLMKGTGEGTQPGRFMIVRTATVNLLTGTDIGSIAFTAAKGDILTADYTGTATPTADPGILSVVETAFITGGTGRFAGAVGSFIITRSFELATNLTSGSFEGTISSPGAKPGSRGAQAFQK